MSTVYWGLLLLAAAALMLMVWTMTRLVNSLSPDRPALGLHSYCWWKASNHLL